MPEYRVNAVNAPNQPGRVVRVEHVDAPARTDVGGDPLTGDEGHEPHKPADDTEQIYYEGSPQLRAEIGRGIWWILLGLVIIAAPVAIYFLHRQWMHYMAWWVFVAAVVVGLCILMVPWLRVKSIAYKISNYRIDVEHGLISRDIDTLEMWHVEDVRFHQSILDRILGVGTITVLSHDDTTPEVVLRGLPHPKSLFETLKQRIIAVKRQRGVVKMDTGG